MAEASTINPKQWMDLKALQLTKRAFEEKGVYFPELQELGYPVNITSKVLVHVKNNGKPIQWPTNVDVTPFIIGSHHSYLSDDDKEMFGDKACREKEWHSHQIVLEPTKKPGSVTLKNRDTVPRRLLFQEHLFQFLKTRECIGCVILGCCHIKEWTYRC